MGFEDAAISNRSIGGDDAKNRIQKGFVLVILDADDDGDEWMAGFGRSKRNVLEFDRSTAEDLDGGFADPSCHDEVVLKELACFP